MAEAAMAGTGRIHADRHDTEIQRNRDAWNRKPSLRKVYAGFQKKIRGHLTRQPNRLIVEIGSGIGSIKEVIPECVTTDIFPNPWLDRQENAYALSFPDGSLSSLILFDVWHHLEFPGTALREFSRVLAPKGRLILFEPAMSLLGRFVYSNFHHEPVGMKAPVVWDAPEHFSPSAAPYFAAQSRATRMFLRREIDTWRNHWDLVAAESITSFSYLLSGGFSGPQLYPDAALPLLKGMDRLLGRFPGLFAARLLVVLEKK